MRKLLWIFSIPLILLVAISISALGISGCGKKIGEDIDTGDTTPPGALVASPPGGEYCPTTVTLSCDDPEATIYYTLDGTDTTTASPVYTGPIEISVDTTLKFMAVDACGNQSGTVTEVYMIDTTSPEAPTITSPADGSTLCATTVVTVIACDNPLDTCEERINTGVWQGCNTGFVVPGSGSYTVERRCIDVCNNISTLASSTFAVDVTPPGAPTITSPADGSTLCTTMVVTDIDCANPADTCEERYDAGPWHACNNVLVVPGSGRYTVEARCIDACENISLLSSVTFYVYSEAPVVNIISPPMAECIESSTVSVIANSDGGEIVTCTIDGGSPIPAPGNWTGVTDGPHTIECSATDDCNTGSASVVIKVDTVAVVSITSPVDGETVIIGDVTVSGTSDNDITTITVTTDQGLTGEPYNSPVIAGNWSVILIGVDELSITITAQGTNNCGNIGSDSVTVPVITPPCTVSGVTPTTGCPGDSVTIIGITFGVTAGSVSFDSVTATITSWIGTSIVVSAPGGDYSNVTVTTAATDLCSLPGTYSYDDVPPPPPIISYPVEGQPSSPVTSNINCDDPADTCEERYDSGAWQTCGSPTTLVLSGHTIEARCTDSCGNVGPIAGPVNFGDPCPLCPCGFGPGAPVLIQSLPRNGPGNLPPDSVTLNMPENAYLKFVYDQSLNITGASASIGTLSLEETYCIFDTLVWSATLDYETDYNLSITGVVDIDEGNAVPDINLTLRTARNVVYSGTPAARRAQSGEGFLDGSLIVRVIDDLDGTEIADAVVQINTSVTWDDPGWVKEIDKTDANGSVIFASATVALNQPITITVMAPGYQYLTWYELDAREVILGLRLRGEGIAARQTTNVIGDFPPAGFDNGIHPQITSRPESGGIPNPLRVGMASLGFYKRTINTLLVEDIIAPEVLTTMTPALCMGLCGVQLFFANLFLPDIFVGRHDIPAATPFFEDESFYRLRTYRTGDVYINVTGATANIQDIDLGATVFGYINWVDVLIASPFTSTCFDIQKITVPDIGAGSCLTLIVDGNTRGVTSDPLTGCTNIASSGRRMVLDHYSFGWSGQGMTDSSTWYEPGFTFARAIRVNMSNWPDDPDMSENYSARIKCTDHHGQPAPCRIPTLQLGLLQMPDETQIGINLGMTNFVDSSTGIDISSRLLGLPDMAAIETDLGLPAGTLTVVVATTAFDWEIRFDASMTRRMVAGFDPHGQCTVGPCYLMEASEWLPWVYGIDPLDPGVPGRDEPGNPAISPDNDLVNRIFEAPELVAADVIDDAQPGVDPEFNSELLMMRLIDSVTDLSSCLEPSYQVHDYDDGGTLFYKPAPNPVWRFYAPPALIQGGTVRIYLPKIPTVEEIDALAGAGQGQAYTFESPTQTGVPDGFELEWAINATNLPTHANMNNLVERDVMMHEVSDMSQNRQRFIFQRP